MREGNFSFTSQGRASVCITAQLYDRRALDATSALPLNNSLTHLTYLTSTSPRIREILTVDGGLECLVRMLLDFCNRPPPPLNPRHFYGLIPPGQTIHHAVPHSTSSSSSAGGDGRWGAPFDRGAAHRFSLAFQCVVNVGVRGSESIRSRVVQAGMLSVVGSVLEQWLLSKGFAVVPSSTGSGAPRESRQVRHARRQEELERRQRETQARQAAEIARALNRQTQSQSHTLSQSQVDAQVSSADEEAEASSGTNNVGSAGDDDEEMIVLERPPLTSAASGSDASMSLPPRPSSSSSDVLSAQSSTANTPVRSLTPNEAESSSRSRSGTVRARPTSTPHASTSRAGPSRRTAPHRRTRPSGETDLDDTEGDEADEHNGTGMLPPNGNAGVTVVGSGDAGIDIFDSDGAGGFGAMTDMGGVGVGGGMVNLGEENDAMAMGAPPGAPGATATTAAATPRASVIDVTPRPALPAPLDRDRDEEGMTMGGANMNMTMNMDLDLNNIATALDNMRGANDGARVILQNLAAGVGLTMPGRAGVLGAIQNTAGTGETTTNAAGDVVRTIMAQSPELRHHTTPTRASLASTSGGNGNSSTPQQGPFQDEDVLLSLQLLAYLSKYPYVRQAFYESRQGTGTPASAQHYNNLHNNSSAATADSSSSSVRSPNIFSLVERFTFRPSPSEPHLPRLPQEIQYWAGVIMRNACRKDESRGGIRQCASMTCGKWEKYPREFAKCRRCRKAKYCGKDCQSRAWAEGHRFWCNVKEPEEEAAAAAAAAAAVAAVGGTPATGTTANTTAVAAPDTDAGNGAGGTPAPTATNTTAATAGTARLFPPGATPQQQAAYVAGRRAGYLAAQQQLFGLPPAPPRPQARVPAGAIIGGTPTAVGAAAPSTALVTQPRPHHHHHHHHHPQQQRAGSHSHSPSPNPLTQHHPPSFPAAGPLVAPIPTSASTSVASVQPVSPTTGAAGPSVTLQLQIPTYPTYRYSGAGASAGASGSGAGNGSGTPQSASPSNGQPTAGPSRRPVIASAVGSSNGSATGAGPSNWPPLEIDDEVSVWAALHGHSPSASNSGTPAHHNQRYNVASLTSVSVPMSVEFVPLTREPSVRPMNVDMDIVGVGEGDGDVDSGPTPTATTTTGTAARDPLVRSMSMHRDVPTDEDIVMG